VDRVRIDTNVWPKLVCVGETCKPRQPQSSIMKCTRESTVDIVSTVDVCNINRSRIFAWLLGLVWLLGLGSVGLEFELALGSAANFLHWCPRLMGKSGNVCSWHVLQDRVCVCFILALYSLDFTFNCLSFVSDYLILFLLTYFCCLTIHHLWHSE